MKGNFMSTIIKSLLCLAILIALIGTANAQGPPTTLVGSWTCEVVQGEVAFLVNFELGGTLTAGGPIPASVYYGTWKRTGINTFVSKDFGFVIDTGCITMTDTQMTMSDNDNFTATAEIQSDCIEDDTVTFSCERTKI